MALNEEMVRTGRRFFDFLIHDCGFTFTSSSKCIRYDSADLYVEIWLGQGDNDFLIGLKKDTEKIRPGDTHLFSFQQLIRHFHKKPFPQRAQFPRPTGMSDEEHYLGYFSHWAQRYLLDLLKGDLSVLDDIASR